MTARDHAQPQAHGAPREHVRLTMAQALVRYLAALRVDVDGAKLPLFGGVFAIFGHGNVAGIGEALYAHRDALPTYRAHNEQAMAHAAIAYAKANMRRRMMACTTSIGPGATNLVTAAALAHVNRLPVLLLPGDVFVSRAPDPVLQQVEDFQDGTVSANDCLRPVSRYFDRIVASRAAADRAAARAARADRCRALRPGDAGAAAGRADDGVRLSGSDLRRTTTIDFARRPPDEPRSSAPSAMLRGAKRPLLICRRRRALRLAGDALRAFADTHGVPVAETQAGKGALPWDHPLQLGAIGVTGSPAANALARDADVVLAVGTRLQDFTTGSHSLFDGREARQPQRERLRRDQVARPRAAGRRRRGSRRAVARARRAGAPKRRGTRARPRLANDWRGAIERITGRRDAALPYEGEVIGAVQRSASDSPADDIVVCAAGTLPAELHKLWRTVDARRLPHRVRLLVHGLRDRRRTRRRRWRSPTAR